MWASYKGHISSDANPFLGFVQSASILAPRRTAPYLIYNRIKVNVGATHKFQTANVLPIEKFEALAMCSID